MNIGEAKVEKNKNKKVDLICITFKNQVEYQQQCQLKFDPASSPNSGKQQRYF